MRICWLMLELTRSLESPGSIVPDIALCLTLIRTAGMLTHLDLQLRNCTKSRSACDTCTTTVWTPGDIEPYWCCASIVTTQFLSQLSLIPFSHSALPMHHLARCGGLAEGTTDEP